MTDKSLIFKPYYVQKGQGPNLGKTLYAFDSVRNSFYSDVQSTAEGLAISNTYGNKRFGITCRWNVEGYGFLKMFADNGGDYYELPSQGNLVLNLNFELARSRYYNCLKRMRSGEVEGWKPDKEIKSLLELAEDFLKKAQALMNDGEKCAELAQRSLYYGLAVSERIELEIARFRISGRNPREDFFFGCDTRGYFLMEQDLFFERFFKAFNYATITHYLIGDPVNFEEHEGKKQFSERDKLLDRLLEKGITVEGRPLFWVHVWVTPDWLRKKSYADLLKYIENHTKEVVRHYGDRIKVWEVVNELHDWANELELTPEQTVEITKLVCDVTRAENSHIRLLINNCCPFGEYVQTKKWTERPAKYPQRTPYQFLQDVERAGVDYDIIGGQMYFTRYPLADAIQVLERYEDFGKQVQIAEIGSPSRGISQEFHEKEYSDFSNLPYEWHRHWDENLQADWLENIFTFAYSRPQIEAANWYDLVDPFGFLKSGGILKSVKGEPKAAYHRLLELKERWNL